MPWLLSRRYVISTLCIFQRCKATGVNTSGIAYFTFPVCHKLCKYAVVVSRHSGTQKNIGCPLDQYLHTFINV